MKIKFYINWQQLSAPYNVGIWNADIVKMVDSWNEATLYNKYEDAQKEIESLPLKGLFTINKIFIKD